LEGAKPLSICSRVRIKDAPEAGPYWGMSFSARHTVRPFQIFHSSAANVIIIITTTTLDIEFPQNHRLLNLGGAHIRSMLTLGQVTLYTPRIYVLVRTKVKGVNLFGATTKCSATLDLQEQYVQYSKILVGYFIAIGFMNLFKYRLITNLEVLESVYNIEENRKYCFNFVIHKWLQRIFIQPNKYIIQNS